jgi:hypothetical protein
VHSESGLSPTTHTNNSNSDSYYNRSNSSNNYSNSSSSPNLSRNHRNSRDLEIDKLKAHGLGADADLIRSSGVQLSPERLEALRNPLQVFCPYTPEAPPTWRGKARPPIFSEDRFPTVQPEEVSPNKGRDKLSCPREYIAKLQSPNWSESVDMATLLDEKSKVKVCREFIDRNRHRLWKFNLKYMNLDPVEVYHDILNAPSTSFVGLIQGYIKRESSLNLGSSENFEKNVYSPVKAAKESPNSGSLALLNSLTTSRTSRNERLFDQAVSGLQNSPNRRGYNHAPEYGNFSNYNALLKSNVATALNR